MKKTSLLLLSAAFIVLTAFTLKPEGEEKYPTISIGAAMPMMDYEMLNVDETSMTLKEVKQDNGTLVIFSCNTCPFVIQWEDRYDDVAGLAKRYGIGTALINSNEAKRAGDDSFEMMVAHAEEMNYRIPYLVDENSELANAFGAKTTPHIFLFDRNDQLVYSGAIDDNSKDANAVTERYLQNALNELGMGKEITLKETPAKGCSIKRVKE
jgi:thioredoxin-related protein